MDESPAVAVGVYDADTDVDDGNESESEADFSLKSAVVLLYGVFDDRREFSKTVSRYVSRIEPFMDSTVDFVVVTGTFSKRDRNFDLAVEDNPKVKFVKASFFRDLSSGACLAENMP